MEKYNLDQTIVVWAAFTDDQNQASNPNVSITLEIRKPSGTVVTKVYDGDPTVITNISPGQYESVIELDEKGFWIYRWIGRSVENDIPRVAVLKSGFSVLSSEITP
jgi:hypothetical protein